MSKKVICEYEIKTGTMHMYDSFYKYEEGRSIYWQCLYYDIPMILHAKNHSNHNEYRHSDAETAIDVGKIDRIKI